MASVKQEIHQYLKKESKTFQKSNIDLFTTITISSRLNISRGLTSQYLNELFKEGELIKICSRPVLFLDKKVIEEKYNINLQICSFDFLDDFIDILNQEANKLKDFEKAIGYNSSLAHIIDQCKAAIQYSDNGIPLVITGQRGTGKTLLAKLLFEYGINSKILNYDYKLFVINCREYSKKRKTVTISIVTYDYISDVKTVSFSELLKYAKENRILYFDNIDYLEKEQLIDLADTYLNDTNISERPYVFFSVNLPMEEKEPELFLNRIPIVVTLPTFEERSLYEKKQFISYALNKESQKISKNINISGNALNIFYNFKFSLNIIDVFKTIKYSCAFASIKTDSDLFIDVNALPNELLMNIDRVDLDEKDTYLSSQNLLEDENINILTNLFKRILIVLNEQFKSNEYYNDEFLNLIYHEYLVLSDYVIYELNYKNDRLSFFQDMISKVFYRIEDKYNIVIPMNAANIFAKYFMMKSHANYFLESTNSSERCMLSQQIKKIEKSDPNLMFISKEIERGIQLIVDNEISDIDRLLLLSCIHYYNRKIVINKTLAFIICHGHSTASSMADIANSILNEKIFSPIDMPINSSAKDIVKKIRMYINQYEKDMFHRVVILIDMGSLSEIGLILKDNLNVDIYVIDNITTKLVLEIGLEIANKEIDIKLLEDVCKQYEITCSLYGCERKTNAIFFVSDSGQDFAVQFANLFLRSLPLDCAIKIIPIEYELSQNKELFQRLKKQYNVIFISGNSNYFESEIPFIPIEHIISQTAMEKMGILLKPYMKNEFTLFQQNLAKNFSLKNIMESITFLDPVRLFNLVEESVYNLELSLNLKFDFSLKVGLYIHLGCLIERLVTGKTNFAYMKKCDEDIPQSFKKSIRQSFINITNVFNITIPENEIVYIFDYIYAKD